MDFGSQITELHQLVRELRSSLVTALTDLAELHDSDRNWQQQLEFLKTNWEKRFTGIEDMVQMFKSDHCEIKNAQNELCVEIERIRRELGQFGIHKPVRSTRRLRALSACDDGFFQSASSTFRHSPSSDQDSGVKTTAAINSDWSTDRDSPINDQLLIHKENGGSPEDGYMSDCSSSDVATIGRSQIIATSDWNNITSFDVDYKSDKVSVEDSLDMLLFNRFMTDDQSQALRYEVAVDLLRTERHYCSCLWNLVQYVYEPLRDSHLIPEKELNQMFPSEILSLYEQHCTVLHRLQVYLGNYDPEKTSISDIFIRIATPGCRSVTLYTAYVRAFPKITQLVKKLFRSNDVELMSVLDRPLPVYYSKTPRQLNEMLLTGMLVYPIQRIPQYTLYFQRLLKHTSVLHPDYDGVKSVLENLRRLGYHLNMAGKQSPLRDNNNTSPSSEPPPVKPRRKKQSKTPDTVSRDPSCTNIDSQVINKGGIFVKRSPSKIIRRHSNCSSGAAAKITRSTSQLRVRNNPHGDFDGDVDYQSDGMPVNLDDIIHELGMKTNKTEKDPEEMKIGSSRFYNAASEPNIGIVSPNRFETSTPSKKDSTKIISSSVLDISVSDSEVTMNRSSFRPSDFVPSKRKSCRRQRSLSRRNIHSIRSSLLAFFSRKKNQHRFGKNAHYGMGTLP